MVVGGSNIMPVQTVLFPINFSSFGDIFCLDFVMDETLDQSRSLMVWR